MNFVYKPLPLYMKSGGFLIMKDSFDKEVDKIITKQVNNIDIREDSYIPDVNKFSDYLKFKEVYPKGDYYQFQKYCQISKKLSEKNK